MDSLHGSIVIKKTQLQNRTKSLPLQLFGHSTNLCKTHDHQTGEAPQVYLTYIPIVALRIKCSTCFLLKLNVVTFNVKKLSKQSFTFNIIYT